MKNPLIDLNFKLIAKIKNLEEINKNAEQDIKKLLDHIALLELKIDNITYIHDNEYQLISSGVFKHESPF